MVVLAPLSSLTLPSGRAKPLVRGEVDGDPAAWTVELSIFLREQDVLGEDDFLGPQMGTMLHAWRMGWNFTSRKES